MFRNREDAARGLAERIATLGLEAPLILAVPRGGVVVGAAVARRLGAELDVVLSRKLRAPHQPELALGAVSEDGEVLLNAEAGQVSGVTPAYIEQERRRQLAEIERRTALFRAVRPRVQVEGRDVVVVDDGIATGATLISALDAVRHQGARRVVAAVPVAPPDRLDEIARHCDELVCLLSPHDFWAVGQFYDDFGEVVDDDVVRLLRDAVPPAQATA